MTEHHDDQTSTVRALDALAPLRAALVGVLGDDLAHSTWLVGGVVRDALLERPLLDVDIATCHDPQRVARRIARAANASAFPLGDAHGCWRVTTTDPDGFVLAGAPALQLDVCALRGTTIEEDVRHRDFTANALAAPLIGTPAIIDEVGGVGDATRGILRMTSAAAIEDDPLRMLRAARIAHLLDWEIDEPTVQLIRSRAARITEPSGERVFSELSQLLLHREARRGWRLLERLDLADVVLPELAACRGLAQSAFHHLDVYEHTLAVLDNAEDMIAAPEFWLGAPLPKQLGDEDRLIVLLSAITHDLGKPATRALRADGRVSFVGHDDVGADIVDEIAERWRWSGRVRGRVRRLVATHLDLGFALHGSTGERERWRLRRSLDPVQAEAIILSMSDRLATAGVADRRRWVRAHMTLARTLWNDLAAELRDGIPTPLLDGRELAKVAGISPGPRVGELVVALAEAQAVGDVRDRAAAIELVRSLSGSTAPAP